MIVGGKQTKRGGMNKPAIRLSEIIIKRNNEIAGEKKEEVLDEKFQLTREISKWKQKVDPNDLYQMSLIGHLIDLIEKEENGATLTELLEQTEPCIKFLRKLNGKEIKGKLEKIVKGGLSGKVFSQSQNDNKWHIVEQRVKEFKTEANIKLKNFLDKECRKKIQYRDDQQEKRSKENVSQIQVKKQIPQLNIQMNWDEFIHSLSDRILKNLQKINQQQKIDDRILGILIAFKKQENKLDLYYKPKEKNKRPLRKDI